MYFSKRFQRQILKQILKGKHDVYAIKLKVGLFENTEEELTQICDAMFIAWNRIVVSKSRGYLRNYDGIIKRLFFEEKDGLFSPFFYLLCAKPKKFYQSDEEYKRQIEKEQLKMQTYIKWFSAWSSALKICTNVSVGFSLVELEQLERIIGNFCTNEKYTLYALIDETKKELLKKASGNGRHKLVTYGGIFSNRQLSVER